MVCLGTNALSLCDFVWIKSPVGKIWGGRKREMEGSENGPHEGQGCEESCKVGKMET